MDEPKFSYQIGAEAINESYDDDEKSNLLSPKLKKDPP